MVRKLDNLFPPIWAESWDFAGFLVGDPWADITRVMLALDPLPAVFDEAAEKGIHLLITHHPPDLKPPRKVVKGDPLAAPYYTAAANGIAYYAIHTALDVSRISAAFALAALLDFENSHVLVPKDGNNLVKFVVFVPEDHTDRIRDALFTAGAGHIGKYSECSFRTPGEGTFKPGAGTNPYSGNRGELRKEKEHRLEMIVPREKIAGVIATLLKEHPYEEVAYDIYPLETAPGRLGFGAIGNLPAPVTLLQIAQQLKGMLPTAGISISGPDSTRISRVAIANGSGGDFIDNARAAKADVLITGEAGYHKLRYAQAVTMPMILLGHFASEWIGLPLLKTYLEKRLWDTLGEGTIEIAQSEHGPVWMT